MPVMSWPSKVMRPDHAGTSPAMVFIVTLLPAPLSPNTPAISPSATEKLTPCSTWLEPNPVVMSSTSSSGAAHQTASPR